MTKRDGAIIDLDGVGKGAKHMLVWGQAVERAHHDPGLPAPAEGEDRAEAAASAVLDSLG